MSCNAWARHTAIAQSAGLYFMSRFALLKERSRKRAMPLNAIIAKSVSQKPPLLYFGDLGNVST
jgi:hypothetical protein